MLINTKCFISTRFASIPIHFSSSLTEAIERAQGGSDPNSETNTVAFIHLTGAFIY